MSRGKGRSFQRQCQSLWGGADPGISTTMAWTSWRETAMWGLFTRAHGASHVTLCVKRWSFVKEPQSQQSAGSAVMSTMVSDRDKAAAI